ncbi:UvrD-helicase domain-containing protein [Streptococcus equi]|uniref:UvrD-helicase domain-containing protein n=1 Tax=Streptococcus equi TaxID=1336 RepID=UPI001E2B5B73|nr:UvrD-helicase domain-containing protein [Streptococcus equi]MCD3391236.1 UvrD-helicase domain-containing protein [Streptococcus equi subsp. zooepidemicus]
MDKRIVLASAGAGKTYFIANDFSDGERTYLITFTHRNVENIRNELLKRFNGTIPENIRISTFDSFVYNQLVRPFEPIGNFPDIKSRGVEVNIEPSTDPQDYNNYFKLDNPRHFLLNDKFYVTRLSKFFIKQDNNFKKAALDRLRYFCDTIYIDEFQDYNGWDFKLIEYLMKSPEINVIAVGDIFQSLVANIRRDGKGSNLPFAKVSSIDDLSQKLPKKVKIDTTTLVKSRRVAPKVCSFINDHLGIPIESSSDSDGEIKWLNNISEVRPILMDSNIPKLVWDNRFKYTGISNFINWSYSKGDTYPKTCIILTEPTSILSNWNTLSNEVRNKLYVALTRSLGDVYLISSAIFKEFKNSV